MFKDIVVNLPLEGKPTAAVDYAISVAEAFEAHIAGIAFAYEPVVAPTVMGGVPSDWVDAQRSEAETTAKAAAAKFEAAAKRGGLSVEHNVLPATVGAAADLFGKIARHFDVSVIGQTEPERPAPEELIIEGALFGSGRPVIVVPYIQKQGLKLDRVLVCWDGGRAAARAIADATPLLQRAKTVEVLVVAGGRKTSDAIPGFDIGHHLARYGLKIDVKRIIATDIDVPNAILSYAADSSSDFIVMGGYGHSRLRELALGGVTRTMLQEMTVPVLLSH